MISDINGNMSPSKIVIDSESCNSCNNCVLACPWNIFIQNDKHKIPQIVHEKLCVSCGHCLAVCSEGAITHVDFTNGTIHPTNQTLFPTNEQILELLRTRRSVRVFQEKTVGKKLIQKIIDDARYAPSTNNIQSTKFIVVQNNKTIKKITEMTAQYLEKSLKQLRNPLTRTIFQLIAKNEAESMIQKIHDYETIIINVRKGTDLILHDAPVVLFFHSSKRVGFSDVNAHLIIQNAMLLIHSLGLGSFYAGYVVAACKQSSVIAQLLNVPKNHTIHGCLALGHPQLQYSNWIERKKPNIAWK